MLEISQGNNPTENSVENDRKNKSIIPKMLSPKRNNRGCSSIDLFELDIDDLEKKKNAIGKKAFMEASPIVGKSLSVSGRQTSPGIEGLNLSNYEQPMTTATEIKECRVFVATWNVGGNAPNPGLNLEDFLQVEGSADIYVCGFQEIVPLSAGNILVIEDNEPAAKWLALISQALNNPQQESTHSCDQNLGRIFNSKDSKSNNFFHKPSLKVLSKHYRANSKLLKVCNCPVESPVRERRRSRKIRETMCRIDSECNPKSSIDEILYMAHVSPLFCSSSQMTYGLVASKQMVGLFISVWARKELIPHIGHLRISSIGRGIMGCLGNKGCISISMSVHRTSFCFVCSHLASGEKEGDELKRNADVAEIVKSTQFPKICKDSNRPAPERILDHDRIIWLGDLNYRVALSYEETRVLLEDNDWDTLLEKDQLNMEREAGRVFTGFKEGSIFFAPTYKYSQNSDSYAGETVKSKKKRRTPAWCDRILWRGNGIEQLSYIRGESRFSDHRPVCAVFAVEVEVTSRNNKFKKGYSYATTTTSTLEYDDCIPQRHSFYGQ